MTYAARILYTFSAAGMSFTGNRVSCENDSSEGPSHIHRVVGRYPEGKGVREYCMPDNPKTGVLEPELQTGAYIPPGLRLFFFVVGSLSAILPESNERGKMHRTFFFINDIPPAHYF